jgi:hypothetical protein
MVAPRAFPNWVGLSISSFNARLIHFFRMFLFPYDITFKLLSESTSYFGYNPRRCFDASISETRLRAKKNEVLNQINYTGPEPSHILKALLSYRTGADAASQTIFQLYPANDLRQLELCHTEPVSRWVFDSLLDICEKHEADAVAQLYRRISLNPWVASFQGHLFRRQVLTYLDGIHTTRYLSIRGLTKPGQKSWTYRGRMPRITFQELKAIDEIMKVVEANKPVHLVPSATNFAAVDSIVYDPKEVLTCIQVTMNSKHPIAVSGLQRIERWLQPDTPPAYLRPTETKPWRIIFIVPPDMASSFTKQKLEGDTAEGEWAGKVVQYVVGLEVGK